MLKRSKNEELICPIILNILVRTKTLLSNNNVTKTRISISDKPIVNEDLTIIKEYIQDNLIAKLHAQHIDKIILALPDLPDTIHLSHVGVLSGIHSHCLHKSTQGITDKIPVMKSRDGKTVSFCCETTRDAQATIVKINSELSEYGYDAQRKGKFVIVKTSDDTSISTMLTKIGLRGLYCLHENDNEEFHFGVPSNVNDFNITEEIKIRKKIAKKKFGIMLELPNKLSVQSCDIYIPNSDSIDPNFIKFIIEHEPTLRQLKTYMCLYQLVQIGIPIQHIDKWDLVTIIHAHTGVKISTLKHHLVDNKKPLQKRIMGIFEYSRPVVNISPYFIKPEDGFLNTLDYNIRAIKELSENNPTDK